MKKHYGTRIFAILATIAMFAVAAMFSGCATESLSDGDRRDDDYFSMSYYYVAVNVGSDRSAKITETITLSYWYYFTRYISVPENARIRNASMYELVENDDGDLVKASVGYRVFDSDGCIVLDVGDDDYKNEEHTYVITYEYKSLPSASIDGTTLDNSLALTLLGDKWEFSLKNVYVTINFPVTDYEILYAFSGSPDNIYSSYSTYTTIDETLTFNLSSLTSGKALNFYIGFEDGVLHNSRGDFLPWISLIIGIVILAVLVILKFLLYRNGGNDPQDAYKNIAYTPLDARRTCEKKIEDRDVVSLMYYWAELGYLKIDTRNESNPVFVRAMDSLPKDCPESWRSLYAAIFANGDRASIKSVGPYIYPEIEKVKREANKKRYTGYDTTSIVVASVFALLGALLLALTPMLIPMRISAKLFAPIYFVAIIPAALIFAFCAATYAGRRRIGTAGSIIAYVVAIVIGGVGVGLYAWAIPVELLSLAVSIITGILGLAIVVISSTLVTEMKDYDSRYNEVQSLKNFIMYAEPSQIEELMKEDPTIYYHLLPYAQMLRVETLWNEKFKSMTIPAPQWLTQTTGNVRFSAVRDTIKSTYDTIAERTSKENRKR